MMGENHDEGYGEGKFARWAGTKGRATLMVLQGLWQGLITVAPIGGGLAEDVDPDDLELMDTEYGDYEYD